MKTLQYIIVLGSILSSGSLMAETSWVETSFWKAPQVKNFSIKLKGREKLTEECSLYKKAVFKEDGSLTYIAKDPERLARFRKSLDPIVLLLEAKSIDRIEKFLKVEEEMQKSSDLPYFVQNEATTGILLGDFEKIEFSSDEGSYTKVSEMLKLEPTQIEFKDYFGNYAVILQGRDVACDLFEGKGSLNLKVPSYVILGDHGYEKLDSFYNKKLIPEISDLILSKTEVLTSKATRLGYRTGKVIEDEFQGISGKDSEKQLMLVMKSLFNSKNLETNPSVIKSGTQVVVNFDDRSEAQPVTVKVEF